MSVDGENFKMLNEMQEVVIGDLIKLMRSSVNDLSTHYVNAGQEALKFCKDPLALMEVRSNRSANQSQTSGFDKVERSPSAVPSSFDRS